MEELSFIAVVDEHGRPGQNPFAVCPACKADDARRLVDPLDLRDRGRAYACHRCGAEWSDERAELFDLAFSDR